MRPTKTSYRSFLLRVWSTEHDTATRASITAIETGETRVFVDLDGLCRWLHGPAVTDGGAASSSSSAGHADRI